FCLALPKRRLGFGYVSLNTAAGEYRYVGAHLCVENAMQMTEGCPLHSVITIRRKDGIPFCAGRRTLLLRRVYRLQRRTKIAARSVRGFERFLYRLQIQVRVREPIGIFECLPQRQSDCTSQIELGDSEVVPGNTQVVLFRVKLNGRTRDVDF